MAHEFVDDEEEPLADEGAIALLRRGMAATPELRIGIRVTVAMAIVGAAGKLALPILIQQIVDRGLRSGDDYRPGFVLTACLFGSALIMRWRRRQCLLSPWQIRKFLL